MKDEQWEMTEERIKNFEFSGGKCFNMLISDKMFRRLEAFGKKGVKELIAVIVSVGSNGMQYIKTDCPEWKMFQHIIPEEELRQYRKQKRLQKQNNSDESAANSDENSEKSENVEKVKEKTKKRKHYHHFVDLSISRSDYSKLLQARNRLNTFSMAMIVRILVEIFLDLSDKYGDKIAALRKLVETIKDMHLQRANCNVEFILLKHKKKESALWRAVAYFQVEYFDESNNRLYFFRMLL